ncbi:beta-lactamase [Periconia macrospinosa]|uniref:Beta-lactamase n=1 Tax=Periconia macrospinosa TaxID=97972 RepID=A0A2V1E6W9_9PLEO|nr:beta-lactamase [Periconia macrospinosa]
MQSFEASLAKATKKDSNGLAGAVAAVVDKTGKFLYQHVQGTNGVSAGAAPLQFDQTYFLASATKLIASIAALQCVERGLIKLDDPLDKHIPEFTSQKIITPTEDGGFELHDATKPVTLRHLLTHSSGAAYTQFIPSLMAWRESQGQSPFEMSRDVAKKYPEPRLFEAGEGWMYGSSTDWAGLLVSRLTSQSLGDYVEANIASPLNITSFTWQPERKPAVADKLMRISVRQPDGSLVDMTEPLVPVFETENGGAGMHANVEDYTRVLVDLISDTPVLLKPETIELLFTPQFADGGPEQTAMIPIGAMTWGAHTGRRTEGITPNYALGGYIVTHDVEREDYLIRKGTLRWSGMLNLHWGANKERGVGYMFATQILPWNDDVSQDLAAEFETAVWRTFG